MFCEYNPHVIASVRTVCKKITRVKTYIKTDLTMYKDTLKIVLSLSSELILKNVRNLFVYTQKRNTGVIPCFAYRSLTPPPLSFSIKISFLQPL